MRNILITAISFLAATLSCFSQIGIGTQNPQATLDIATTASFSADGMLIPQYTASEIHAKNALYTSLQNGVLVFITSGAGILNTKTEDITDTGYYFYNAPEERWRLLGVDDRVAQNFGDIKESFFETSDHNGWVKLDGRPLTLLTSGQQTQASLLGLTANLPDATNAVLSQNTNSPGQVTGSNTRFIERQNLPNIALNGTTNATGAHTHSSSNGGGSNVNTTISTGATRQKGTVATVTTSSSGAHTHTFTTTSINGGVTQMPLDITPQSLSVALFLYLGN